MMDMAARPSSSGCIPLGDPYHSYGPHFAVQARRGSGLLRGDSPVQGVGGSPPVDLFPSGSSQEGAGGIPHRATSLPRSRSNGEEGWPAAASVKCPAASTHSTALPAQHGQGRGPQSAKPLEDLNFAPGSGPDSEDEDDDDDGNVLDAQVVSPSTIPVLAPVLTICVASPSASPVRLHMPPLSRTHPPPAARASCDPQCATGMQTSREGGALTANPRRGGLQGRSLLRGPSKAASDTSRSLGGAGRRACSLPSSALNEVGPTSLEAQALRISQGASPFPGGALPRSRPGTAKHHGDSRAGTPLVGHPPQPGSARQMPGLQVDVGGAEDGEEGEGPWAFTEDISPLQPATSAMTSWTAAPSANAQAMHARCAEVEKHGSPGWAKPGGNGGAGLGNMNMRKSNSTGDRPKLNLQIEIPNPATLSPCSQPKKVPGTVEALHGGGKSGSCGAIPLQGVSASTAQSGAMKVGQSRFHAAHTSPSRATGSPLGKARPLVTPPPHAPLTRGSSLNAAQDMYSSPPMQQPLARTASGGHTQDLYPALKPARVSSLPASEALPHSKSLSPATGPSWKRRSFPDLPMLDIPWKAADSPKEAHIPLINPKPGVQPAGSAQGRSPMPGAATLGVSGPAGCPPSGVPAGHHAPPRSQSQEFARVQRKSGLGSLPRLQ